VPAEVEPTAAFAQAMATQTGSKATPRDAFERARSIVHSGQRLDMVALAADLGIARGTLYRWTGDRERLLSDVLWADLDGLLANLLRTPLERGRAGIQAIAMRFLELLTTGDLLVTILRTEGDTAFRLITDPKGRVRPGLVEMLAAHIQREVDDGFYRPPEEPHLLAEGMITIGERFLYNGGNVTANPDPITAYRIMNLLIREE
jgi:AcrR family transcriptional regulator